MGKRDKDETGWDKAAGQHGNDSGESSTNASSRDLDPIASTSTLGKPHSSGDDKPGETNSGPTRMGEKQSQPPPVGPAPESSKNDLVTLKPADRRLEQSMLQMLPPPTEQSANAPTTSDSGEKKYKSSAHRLAHLLERVRDRLFETNSHLSSGTLVQEIDAALAEHNGTEDKPREPVGPWATPSNPTENKPVDSVQAAQATL